MILKDLVKTLQSRGVAAAYAEQDPDTDDKIAVGQCCIVYGSPDTFVGKDR